MTDQAARHELPGGPPPAPSAPALPVAVQRATGIDGVLESLWSLLTSMRFGLILILAIAGLALLGTVIIQAPPGIQLDPAAKADWLAGVRPKYGGWTDILDRLQVFTIFNSTWFRILVGVLAASLVACSSQRLPALWRTATRPRVAVADRFFESAPQHELIVVRDGPEQAAEHVSAELRRRHYRVITERDGPIHLYADRFRWGPMGTVMTHLSLVVILAGAMVGSMFGFRDGEYMIPEGSARAVPGSPGLEARLVNFDSSFYTDTGAPSDYASEIVLYEGGREVARHTVRVNEPMRYGDLSFYQSFYGPAAIVRMVDPTGRELFADGVALGWTAQEGGRRVGTFTAREADLTVWVVGTSGTGDPVVKPGQMRIELYRASDGEAIGSKTLDQGVTAEIDGFAFTFERELQFTGLSVARDPGTPLVWAGAVLLMAGVILVLMFPHRRVWARISSGAQGRTVVSIAGVGRRDVEANSHFTDLVTDIRAAFRTPART